VGGHNCRGFGYLQIRSLVRQLTTFRRVAEQPELSEPVAVLLNETDETVALASSAGFRCFTSAAAFKNYLQNHILASDVA